MFYPDFDVSELVIGFGLTAALVVQLVVLAVLGLVAWRGKKAARVLAALVMLAALAALAATAVHVGHSWWINLLPLVAGWLVYRAWGRQLEAPHGWQFGLRGVLLLFAVVALALGGRALDARRLARERQTKAALGALGATVNLRFGWIDEVLVFETIEPARFAELCRLLAATSVRRLQAQGSALDDRALACTARLESLEALSLQHAAITGRGLAHLRGLPRLRQLALHADLLGDADLVQLYPLQRLEKLWLYNASFSPAAKSRLKHRLPELDW